MKNVAFGNNANASQNVANGSLTSTADTATDELEHYYRHDLHSGRSPNDVSIKNADTR